MKKAEIALCMIVVLCLAGCKPAYRSEVSTHSGDSQGVEGMQQQINYEQEMKNADWDSTHLTLQLSEDILLDAQIVPESVWNQEFGLYHYTYIDQTESSGQDAEKTKRLADVLDEYIGEKVSFAENAMVIGNPVVTDNGIYFRREEYENYTVLSQVLETFCPMEADIIDDALYQKIMEIQELFYPYSRVKEDTFSVQRLDDAFYDELRDMEEKIGIEPVTDDEIKREGYEIQIRKVLDNGVVLKRLTNISYSTLKGQKESLLIRQDALGGSAPKTGECYMNLFLDTEGELQYADSYCSADIEETPFMTTKICGIQEILQMFSKRMKKTNVIITDVELYYCVALDNKLDENNERDVYLAPYWVITYHAEDDTSCHQAMYEAVNGQMVYWMD